MPSELPQLLTAEEMAALLKISRKAVYAMVERGQVPAKCIRRFGRLLRFHAREVQAWLEQGSHGGGR